MTGPSTPYVLRQAGVVLEADHATDEDYHHWVILGPHNGWPDQVYRDWLGRRSATNYRFLVLRCNNTRCDAVALYRVAAIEALLNGMLPTPSR